MMHIKSLERRISLLQEPPEAEDLYSIVLVSSLYFLCGRLDCWLSLCNSLLCNLLLSINAGIIV